MWACLHSPKVAEQNPLLKNKDKFENYFLQHMHDRTNTVINEVFQAKNALQYPQLVNKLINDQTLTEEENFIAQIIYIDLSLRANIFDSEPVASIQTLEKINRYVDRNPLADLFTQSGVAWFAKVIVEAQKALSKIAHEPKQYLASQIKNISASLQQLLVKCDAQKPVATASRQTSAIPTMLCITF